MTEESFWAFVQGTLEHEEHQPCLHFLIEQPKERHPKDAESFRPTETMINRLLETSIAYVDIPNFSDYTWEVVFEDPFEVLLDEYSDFLAPEYVDSVDDTIHTDLQIVTLESAPNHEWGVVEIGQKSGTRKWWVNISKNQIGDLIRIIERSEFTDLSIKPITDAIRSSPLKPIIPWETALRLWGEEQEKQFREEYEKELLEKGSWEEIERAMLSKASSEGRKDRYHKYLKSDAWKRLRERVLKKYNNRCAVCNSPFGLQLHHRTYKHICREKEEDLVPLCRDCHRLFHENRELYRDYPWSEC